MEHDIERDGAVSVVRLRGSVAVADAIELRNVLGDQLAGADSRVLIDLTDLGFIDSAGIGVLVGAHRRATQVGARLALAGAQGAVARVLSLTRTDRLLPSHASREDGVRALA